MKYKDFDFQRADFSDQYKATLFLDRETLKAALHCAENKPAYCKLMAEKFEAYLLKQLSQYTIEKRVDDST